MVKEVTPWAQYHSLHDALVYLHCTAAFEVAWCVEKQRYVIKGVKQNAN